MMHITRTMHTMHMMHVTGLLGGGGVRHCSEHAKHRDDA